MSYMTSTDSYMELQELIFILMVKPFFDLQARLIRSHLRRKKILSRKYVIKIYVHRKTFERVNGLQWPFRFISCITMFLLPSTKTGNISQGSWQSYKTFLLSTDKRLNRHLEVFVARRLIRRYRLKHGTGPWPN